MSTHQNDTHIQEAYRLAKERYALMGVDVDRAIETLSTVALSL
ncbi:MAG: L-rhamnose isomerase, partial [Chloroflexi bacterium]|nr:L-rhamnose isomerase [Chloroflexota bacterium]